MTKNFKLEEFTRSNTADANGIKNVPNADQKKAIENLCIKLLQPLREKYGKSMPINSGFRNDVLNKLVGGAETSQHKKGEAADIGCNKPAELVRCLMDECLDFDQCIQYPKFVHLSYKLNGANRRQFLRK